MVRPYTPVSCEEVGYVDFIVKVMSYVIMNYISMYHQWFPYLLIMFRISDQLVCQNALVYVYYKLNEGLVTPGLVWECVQSCMNSADMRKCHEFLYAPAHIRQICVCSRPPKRMVPQILKIMLALFVCVSHA